MIAVRAALASLCLLTFSAYEQTTTGDILGTIRDASGGLIVGAKVTVTNLGTNQARDTLTAENGSIRIPDR